jgi:hypothetical protein
MFIFNLSTEWIPSNMFLYTIEYDDLDTVIDKVRIHFQFKFRHPEYLPCEVYEYDLTMKIMDGINLAEYCRDDIREEQECENRTLHFCFLDTWDHSFTMNIDDFDIDGMINFISRVEVYETKDTHFQFINPGGGLEQMLFLPYMETKYILLIEDMAGPYREGVIVLLFNDYLMEKLLEIKTRLTRYLLSQKI